MRLAKRASILLILLTLFVAGQSIADIPVKQVMIEAKFVEAQTSFGAELGIAFPTGDFGDIAKPGPSINFFMGQLINSWINGSFNIGATFFGVEDNGFSVDDRSLTELSAMANIDIALSALEQNSEGEVLSNPKITVGAGVGVASVKFKQSDIAFYDSGPAASIRAGVTIPFSESATIGASGSFTNIFAEDNISYAKANLELRVTPQITPDNRIIMDLEIVPAVGLGVPTGDFGQQNNPGVFAGLKGRLAVTDFYNLIGGVMFQTFGVPFESDFYQQDVSAIDFELGGQFVLPTQFPGGAVPSVTVSTVLTKLSQTYTVNDVETKDNETGLLVLGGLMLEKKINDRVSVGLHTDIPIIGGLFKNETKRKARTELLVFIKPRIVKDN